jgi:hypothetical protein
VAAILPIHPELDQLRAHVSALMPYRVAAGLLEHLLPVETGNSPETLRGHTLKIGEQLRNAATVKPASRASAITVTLDSTFIRGCCDGERHFGGSRRQCRNFGRWPAGFRRRSEGRYGDCPADPAQS